MAPRRGGTAVPGVALARQVPPASSWWICPTREAFMAAHRREAPRICSMRLTPGVEKALRQMEGARLAAERVAVLLGGLLQ